MVNLKRWFNVIKILSLSNNMKQRTKKKQEKIIKISYHNGSKARNKAKHSSKTP